MPFRLCETCDAFSSFGEGWNPNTGECRRQTPTISDVGDDDWNPNAAWPVVSKNSWCMEWNQKVDD